jgi:hypothetical protein
MSELFPGETMGRPGVVAVNSWAGRSLIRVTILPSNGKKRVKVRFEETALNFTKGEIRYVPKGAVKESSDG